MACEKAPHCAFFTISGCWSTVWAVNDVHCLLATKTTSPCWWAHSLHPSPEHWRLYCFPSFTFFSLPGYISPYIYFSKWNNQNINKSVILTRCFSSCLSLILCCLSRCDNYLPEQLKLLADPIVPLWQFNFLWFPGNWTFLLQLYNFNFFSLLLVFNYFNFLYKLFTPKWHLCF